MSERASHLERGSGSGLEKILLFAIVALLVLWPPTHLVLSMSLGFTSWKFAGWGMYATPFPPKNQTLHAYVLPESRPTAWSQPGQPVLLPASLQRPFEVFDWQGEGFGRLVVRKRVASLRPDVDLVKVMRSRASVETLANRILEAADLPHDATTLFVFEIQPRMHPLDRRTYAEVRAYAYRSGTVEKVGTIHTDETSIEDLFASMLDSAGR